MLNAIFVSLNFRHRFAKTLMSLLIQV